MTRDDAYEIVGKLIAAYPNTEIEDEAVELWADFLQHQDVIDASEALTNLLLTDKFFPTIAEFNGELALIRQRNRRAIDRKSTACNGSGFVDADTPCPRCNPVMSTLYKPGNETKLARWRNGTPLHDIFDVDDPKKFRDDWKHEPCHPDPHIAMAEADDVISPKDGKEIARRAYLAECRRQGHEPNLPYFDAVIGRVATAAPAESSRQPRSRPTAVLGGGRSAYGPTAAVPPPTDADAPPPEFDTPTVPDPAWVDAAREVTDRMGEH